ncbi:MAG: hypothetical protein INH41_01680 [Myxococcaceae bacterium]|jgi:hypothetical protein|nr:hypothetical protein [Myxococcaceae bacterium]
MQRALLALSLLAAACDPNRTVPDRAAYAPQGVQPLECVPNLDGRIEASELRTAFGVPVRYLVNPAGTRRPIDLSGVTDAAGRRVWALATDYADDQVATLAASRLDGRWYRASFPTGQFVAPLDLAGALEGVYANDGQVLSLLGYASAREAPPEGRTLVVYASPIATFRFPLESGRQWVTASEVRNATVRGLPWAGRDTYQVRVDGAGTLELPDVTFTQALRVRTTLSIEPAVGAPIVRRQVGFVFECFGEVARAVSQDNEPADDFTTTPELRRLGF